MEQVNEIVFPGDVIAKEEEYLSGKNTQDIDGNIIATAFGKVSRDDKSLVISVDTQKQAASKWKDHKKGGTHIRLFTCHIFCVNPTCIWNWQF